MILCFVKIKRKKKHLKIEIKPNLLTNNFLVEL